MVVTRSIAQILGVETQPEKWPRPQAAEWHYTPQDQVKGPERKQERQQPSPIRSVRAALPNCGLLVPVVDYRAGKRQNRNNGQDDSCQLSQSGKGIHDALSHQRANKVPPHLARTCVGFGLPWLSLFLALGSGAWRLWHWP